MDTLSDKQAPTEHLYTIKIEHVPEEETEAMRKRWPDCEVVEE